MTMWQLLAILFALIAGGLVATTAASQPAYCYVRMLTIDADGTATEFWQPVPCEEASADATPIPEVPPTPRPTATPAGPSPTRTPLPPTFTPPPTATVFPTATAIVGNRTLIVPDQYATARDAYLAANAGDVIALRSGTYNEMLDLRKQALTITTFGEGMAWFDGECVRPHGILITGVRNTIVRNIGVRRTLAASIRLDRNANFGDAAYAVIDGNQLQDYNCDESLQAQGQGGVAFNQTGPGQRVTGNVITRRVELPGIQQGHGNGVWFKSDGGNPSGGGHVITGNVITGGYDGIGGETEGSARGSFDGNTVISRNHVKSCADDGIQAEGNNANVQVLENLIEECGVGIAFANNVVGPLYVEGNTIVSSTPRWNPSGTLDVLACYKVGNGSDQVVYLTANVCTLDYPGDPAVPTTRRGDGLKQTNPGLSIYVLRNNIFRVSRYVIELNGTPRSFSSFDGDCLETSDSSRFIQWAGERVTTLEEFQALTWHELNGSEGPC